MHATSPPQPGSRLFSELVVASTASRNRSSSSTWRSPDRASKTRTRYVPPLGPTPYKSCVLAAESMQAPKWGTNCQRSTKDHLRLPFTLVRDGHPTGRSSSHRTRERAVSAPPVLRGAVRVRRVHQRRSRSLAVPRARDRAGTAAVHRTRPRPEVRRPTNRHRAGNRRSTAHF